MLPCRLFLYTERRMNTSISNVHNHFFKASMSDPRVALEFFETHLPENIKKLADLSTLQIRLGNFVDKELKLQVTDMLFSVDWHGNPGYLYTLVEHQRTPDKWMAFRKLKYMTQIMEQHRKEKGELPLVYVLIIYNGEQKYRYSTDLFHLFGEYEMLARRTFLEPFHLIDLSQVADEDLQHKKPGQVFLKCALNMFISEI